MPDIVHTMLGMKSIAWAKDKAEKLRSDEARNCIGFERCVIAIENGDILAVIDNPVRNNQRLLILEIDSYAYVVPFVETDDEWFFKTVFPSRKYTAIYLKR